MKNVKKDSKKKRFSTHVELDMAEWIELEAAKRFINEALFIRLALRERMQAATTTTAADAGTTLD